MNRTHAGSLQDVNPFDPTSTFVGLRLNLRTLQANQLMTLATLSEIYGSGRLNLLDDQLLELPSICLHEVSVVHRKLLEAGVPGAAISFC